MMSACRGAVVAFGIAAAASTIAFTQAPPPQAPGSPGPQAAPPSKESIQKAEQVLVDARKALGGDKLAQLKSLVASGRTKRVRGNNLVPIEFELMIELPDKYVRVDEFPAEDTDPSSAGFNGDNLIQNPPPQAMPAGRGGPPGAVPGEPAGPPAAGPRAAPPAGATPPAGGTPPAGTPPAGATPPAGGPPQAGATPSAGAPPPSGAPAGAGRGMMPPGGMPGGRGPAMDPRRARVATVKQDYARLALGLFAASSGYPLTFSYAAVAEAPQGRADVLDAKGEGTFALRFFINSETRLPIMISWTTPPTNVVVTVPGQPPPATVAPGAVVVPGPPAPPAGAPKEDMDKYSKEVLAVRAKAQATPVEHRLYFADYRDVDGLKLPFRLRRAIGPETTEETTFDRFRVNAKIDPRKFEPVK
jgi:hypothetical protein